MKRSSARRRVVTTMAALAISLCGAGGVAAAAPLVPGQPCPSGPSAPGGPPNAPRAQLLVPIDTSTSTVINPGVAPQISCGRVRLRTQPDVVYASPTLAGGQQLPLKMDIQIPQTPGPKPVVIYLPGGGFGSAIKEQALDQRTFVAESGFVVASIQYRTIANGAKYTDGIADIRAAVRYLRANASRFSIDPRKVGVWGASAGGYLANMVGTTDPGGRDGAVQAVVDHFGGSDLSKLFADFDAATQHALDGPDNPIAMYVNGPGSGQSLTDNPDAVRAANPVTYVGPGDPPFLHFHGTEDRTISPSQTLLIHNALRRAGVSSTRYVVTGGGHGEIEKANNLPAALPWTTAEVMGITVSFLRSHLR